jgi:hypothetical protein
MKYVDLKVKKDLGTDRDLGLKFYEVELIMDNGDKLTQVLSSSEVCSKMLDCYNELVKKYVRC